MDLIQCLLLEKNGSRYSCLKSRSWQNAENHRQSKAMTPSPMAVLIPWMVRPGFTPGQRALAVYGRMFIRVWEYIKYVIYKKAVRGIQHRPFEFGMSCFVYLLRFGSNKSCRYTPFSHLQIVVSI